MKMRKRLRGTVQKVIKHVGQAEKAQIEVHEADELYRELRVDNEAEGGSDGNKHTFEQGESVNVVIEGDSDGTKKKKE